MHLCERKRECEEEKRREENSLKEKCWGIIGWFVLSGKLIELCQR